MKEGENGTTETEERGDGDGQESSAAKSGEKVDVDEDRRNPAYIPKRGLFYEHDDRLESGEEEEGGEQDAQTPEASDEKPDSAKTGAKGSAEKAALKPKRIFKSDAAERWGHDKFSENDQAPKSSEELVSVYGYDIRNEDNAPRARRRRRYGRGPNKYTRNWEDEAAYQAKPARGGPGGVVGPGGRKKSETEEEAFPPLGEGDRRPAPGPRRQHPRENDLDQQQQYRGKPRERPMRDEREPQQWPERGEHSNRGGPRDDRGGYRGGGRGGRGIAAPFKRGNNERVRSPTDKSGFRNADAEVERVETEMSRVNVSGNRERGGSGRILSQDPDVGGDGKPKRYSSSRPTRGQGPHRGGGTGNANGRENFYQQEFSQEQGQPRRSAGGSTGPGDAVQFAASQAFPNTRNSGPPPDAPFLSVTSSSTIPATGSTPYINPAGGILNYGPPPPVPYAGVPVTVPIPLVGDNPLAMIAASHLSPVQTFVPNPVTTQDPVLLAAAAAAAQSQGYAEVRGGVTYFHPQASVSVRGPAQVSKRPKAAIPIVDPAQVGDQGKAVLQQNGDAKQAVDAQPAVVAAAAPPPVSAEVATA